MYMLCWANIVAVAAADATRPADSAAASAASTATPANYPAADLFIAAAASISRIVHCQRLCNITNS
jgi:hypothetical protein